MRAQAQLRFERDTTRVVPAIVGGPETMRIDDEGLGWHMKIGIGLWCLQSTATAPRSFTQAYAELREDAELAERVGVHSLWLSEHHGYYDGYCPALLPAAAAALSATESLVVGTGVLLLPLQDADRVGRAAADLNQRFDNRFHLGMGMGYRPTEFTAKGLDIAERVRRMNAGLDTLAADRPGPMWVGVTSHPAARRAGKRGLGLMISGAFSKQVVDELVVSHRQAWTDAGCPGGEQPPVGLLRNLWIADSEAQRRQALDWVRSSYLVYAGLGWGADDTGVDFRAQIEASMDEVEASAIVGSADQVADELAQYDVDLVIARIGYDQPPRSALTEVIERIGTELVGMVA
ncbi:MAG TPA: hypothetical protein DCY82_12600 [Acidimicrobiaceae bacterium]|nr:hypothetical protein [Acidimicrobiaceae bacterium]